MSSCQSRLGRSTRTKPGQLRRSSGRRRGVSLHSRTTRRTCLRLTATPSRRRTARRSSRSRRSGWRASPRRSLVNMVGRGPPLRRGPRRRHRVDGSTRARAATEAAPDELARLGDAHAHSHSLAMLPGISSCRVHDIVWCALARSSCLDGFRRFCDHPLRCCTSGRHGVASARREDLSTRLNLGRLLH
jgi:hypothetical protein